jgi:hypothetical protein
MSESNRLHDPLNAPGWEATTCKPSAVLHVDADGRTVWEFVYDVRFRRKPPVPTSTAHKVDGPKIDALLAEQKKLLEENKAIVELRRKLDERSESVCARRSELGARSTS